MSRKTLAWANKEVETFLCILGEEDVVYDVYVATAAIDILPTLKGTVGGGNATSELSWAPFPESIFSLSGSQSGSYEHRTVFTPFPESIFGNEPLKNAHE